MKTHCSIEIPSMDDMRIFKSNIRYKMNLSRMSYEMHWLTEAQKNNYKLTSSQMRCNNQKYRVRQCITIPAGRFL